MSKRFRAISSVTTEDTKQQLQLQSRWRDARAQDDSWRANGQRQSLRGHSGAIGSFSSSK
jgi:hypothetical protein